MKAIWKAFGQWVAVEMEIAEIDSIDLSVKNPRCCGHARKM